MDVDGYHVTRPVRPSHGENRTGHPVSLPMAAAADIADRGMGQIDLVGAPGRGRIRPLSAIAGRLQPAAEKGQLKAEATVVAVGQVSRVIPPFGAVIRVGAVIGGERRADRGR